MNLQQIGMSAILSAALSGFLTCAVLIVAIGAQNMFVLRQGLMRRHVGPVVLLCGSADTVLVSAGVAGAGTLLALVPTLATGLTVAGSAFLAWYGVRTLLAMPTSQGLVSGTHPAQPLGRTLAATAAFTLLNPHVYLDTVLLMGVAGGSLPLMVRPFFVFGAGLASFGWFALLGFGAGRLGPLFRRPATWRVLDGLVGCLMLGLAGKLLLTVLESR